MKKKPIFKKKLHLKIGEKVKIIAGREKGKISFIIKVLKKQNKLIVEGVNIGVKHIKPSGSGSGKNGEIKRIEFPIHSSNVSAFEE
uniref:50S ribosomal protein L24 n=1 Tax=Ascoseira mirabilis TaxID=76830 RepID=UPI0030028004|nr:50S ribosomal protein L24 [Ascoseira mirabilis]